MKNEWNDRKGQFWNRIKAAIGCLKGESVIFRHNVIIHGLPSGTKILPECTDKKGLWLEIALDDNRAVIYTCNVTTPEFGFKNKEQKND